MTRLPFRAFPALAVLAAALALPASALAHCDTLDGPVVAAARLALKRGDIQPALKWVKPEAEVELRGAFQKALAVRTAGGEAQEIADLYFFETLVRLHRAGEGAPYTGLKAAGSTPKPIALADEALALGSVNQFGRLITDHLAAGVGERFARVREAKARAEESAEAGRRYVAAYVDYVHYIEAVVQAVHATGHDHRHQP